MPSAAPRFEPTVIRASAGSGKTFALSNRFISLIAHGESPDRILATTFTRKAAGEILERVYQRLAAASLDSAAAEELGTHLGIKTFSSNDARSALSRLIQCQARLSICTLDSFFVSIAQSFSFELGLTPGWGLADSDDDARLIRDAISELCRHSDPTELAELFYMLNRGDTRTKVHTQLEREIAELYSSWMSSTSAAWRWIKVPRGLSDDAFPKLIAAISKLEIPTTGKGEPNAIWQKAMTQTLSKIEAKDWEYFLENGITGKILSGEHSFGKRPIPPEYFQELEPLLTHLRAFFLGRLREQNQASWEFLSKFAKHFESARQSAQLLNFEGIKDTLASAQVLGDLAELYYRLDSRVAHVLLDEFQDTSRAEWQVLEPMVAEILSKESTENSFFCVGDTKQAIYGWRGGVAEIFERLEERFPQLREHVQHRDESRRSAPEIITAVNKVFGMISEPSEGLEYPEVFRNWGRRFKPHTTALADRTGYVELRAVEGAEGESEDALFAAASDQVKDLVDQNPRLTVGILLRRNRSVKSVLESLWERGIRASGEGGNPLTDSWCVCVLLAALRLSEHPADKISGFLVSRTPLGSALGISSAADTASIDRVGIALRRTIASQGLGDTLKEWATSLKPLASTHDSQRIEQLVGLAHLYRPGRGKRLSDFIEWVEASPVENPSASNVRVMTIHKSKGLEFDVVVLPELDGRIPKPQADSLLLYRDSPSAPPSHISRYADKGVRNLEPRLKLMYEQGKSREVEEALSVLYVALTRARYGLFMLVDAKEQDFLSFSHILRKTLSQQSEGVLLYSEGRRDFARSLGQRDKPGSDRGPPQRSVTLAKSSRGRRRGLLFPLSRALEEGTVVDLKQHLELRTGTDARVDAQLLRLCLGTEWLATLPTAEDLAPSFDPNSPGAAEALTYFQSLLRTKDGRRIFMQPEADVELFRNLPIAVRAKEGIVTGRIDRLVVERGSGRAQKATVYQFISKTAHERGPSDFTDANAVAAYQRAAASFLGIEPSAVEVQAVRLRERVR